MLICQFITAFIKGAEFLFRQQFWSRALVHNVSGSDLAGPQRAFIIFSQLLFRFYRKLQENILKKSHLHRMGKPTPGNLGKCTFGGGGIKITNVFGKLRT